MKKNNTGLFDTRALALVDETISGSPPHAPTTTAILALVSAAAPRSSRER